MVYKKAFFIGLSALGFQSSAFCFTIINQTDSEKVLKIQEAYRPEADGAGDLKNPIPLDYEPCEVSIPPHSSHEISLRESCAVLLVGVVTTEVVEDGDCTTIRKSTNQTCYEPYNYLDINQTLLTDDWGLVIHKPMVSEKSISFSDADYGYKILIAKQILRQGYGIKCLHPKLLEKVTSLDELPDELK